MRRPVAESGEGVEIGLSRCQGWEGRGRFLLGKEHCGRALDGWYSCSRNAFINDDGE